MKTERIIICGFLAVMLMPALVFTGCSSLISAINMDALDAFARPFGNTNEQSGRTASGTANSGSPAQETQFKFTLINDGTAYSVNKGTEISGAVVIPAAYNGLPVIMIGNSAFANTNITSVTIPSSVKFIDQVAFRNCTSLTEITIPDSVTFIGYQAFNGTAWLGSQPDGLVYAGKILYQYKGTMPANTAINNIRADTIAIAGRAFYECTGLISITIPEGVTYIEESAFSKCSSLTSITIPSSVTYIEGMAFRECSSLTSITIPAGVKYIGQEAFASCTSLTSVTIPSSVTSIGDVAFASCRNLTSITVDTQNPAYSSVDGILFNKNRTALITYPAGKQGTTYTIPSSVNEIGILAFGYCRNLTSVTIPSSVTSIGQQAFVGCTGLTSVTIPSSVNEIEQGAFNLCTSLTSVTMSRRTIITRTVDYQGTIVQLVPVFPSRARITYSD